MSKRQGKTAKRKNATSAEAANEEVTYDVD